jgi:hypothetical protein
VNRQFIRVGRRFDVTMGSLEVKNAFTCIMSSDASLLHGSARDYIEV